MLPLLFCDMIKKNGGYCERQIDNNYNCYSIFGITFDYDIRFQGK